MSEALKQYGYFLKILLVRKRLFLIIALTFMTIGVIIAYTLPKKYEAESTVLIDQNVITDLVKGIAVTPSVESKVKKLSVSLLSRTMLLKVLSILDKDLLRNERQLEEYLEDLSRRILINYREKEGVFKISLRDKDPVFARDFINTLTRKYIDENISSKREESLDATKFLAEQIESFKKRIDAADDAINSFKSEKGLTLASDDVFLRGEIANAEKKVEELAIKRSELEAKKRLYAQQGTPRNQLADAQARLAGLRARYTDVHPKVAAALTEVARLRAGKGSATDHLTAASIGDSPEMLQVQIDTIKELENHQSGIVRESKDLLREIPNVRATLNDLIRKKQNEEVVYQQLVSRYGQSEVSKQMELQDKAVTFRILDPAVTPLVPFSPNRLLIIVGSILGGFVLAFGVLLLLDMFKGGIKSPSELREINVPIIAVIPHVPDHFKDIQRRRGDRLLVSLTLGYVMLILVIASADSLRLIDRVAQAKHLIHNVIGDITH